MKIGDGPKLPPLPLPGRGSESSKTAGKTAGAFPDVVKTPSPAGPVPLPYPNTGDSFERVRGAGLGALLGKGAEIATAEAKLAAQKESAWTQLGLSVAAAAATTAGVAGAAAQGALQAITEAAAKGGSGAVADLLSRAGQAGGALGAGVASKPEALIDRVIGEAAKQNRADLVLYGEKVTELHGLAETLTEAFAKGDGEAAGDLGQDLQLRMQTMLDKQAQLMEMLSSIMKKMAETSQQIVGNLR